ncbi:chemotaxis protein CheW [Geomonas paludis]|uniref:Chemotaxis protein CheA n=1 Tax=Geomonas paludis TaxID=2740185 RepID=A0A6V8MXD4_9BACT|nr:chemotaxis protein CheW [Geomonas paludis]UPU37020.1 chemotaxis protein CheW [Geomonas paludis]GFO64886.1 chemotaxis protein CheA [Geomonas paludis]
MTTPRGENETVDLNRFNQVFFEECAENLAEMEQILISLGDREPDPEQMNAIFRAAHSIKGGAGIFGFNDMTVVTHVMESLLDRLRNQEIPFAPGMIDLFLEAGDAIAMQLAGHREGKAVDQEVIDGVRARLQQAIDAGAGAPAPGLPADQEEGPPQQEAEQLPRRCRLAFTPDPEIFTRGIRMESIVAELAELAEPGEFHCNAQLMELPELAEADPERCLTRWEFTLLTRASLEQILDVFMFVADEEQLQIEEDEPVDRRTPEGEPAPEQGIVPAAGRRVYDSNETAPGAFGRRGNETEASFRVNVTKVDQLVNQVGELLITQAMLSQIAVGLDPILHETLQRGLVQLERNTRDLQGSVMSIRLVPISIVFNRFPRLVRDIAAKLGKQVELKTAGDSTELDRGLIEKIADPLGHLVRNALDHGLETPETRAACGKSPTGTLQLSASQVGGRIVIDVIDDGAGLNRDKILAKALECGIPCSEAMTDEEVWQLIFAPGFSTASEVTDLSGRGVGMDVVMKNVQAIGGRVQIASEAGKGARFTISLPLTLAILEGLSVAVGEEKFIIPLNVVIESLQPKPEQLKSVNGRDVVLVRGEYLPILKLHRIFNLEAEVTEPQRGILVLTEADGERGAILVDALLDEQQVVVKSIETNYRRVDGSAGATILGDGRVALILDLPELFTMHKKL